MLDKWLDTNARGNEDTGLADAPHPTDAALIYGVAQALAELQTKGTRSLEAEQALVDSFLSKSRDIAFEAASRRTYLVSSFEWLTDPVDEGRRAVQNETEDTTTKKVTFEGFETRTYAGDQNKWQLRVRQLETNRSYSVPVEHLVDIAVKPQSTS